MQPILDITPFKTFIDNQYAWWDVVFKDWFWNINVLTFYIFGIFLPGFSASSIIIFAAFWPAQYEAVKPAVGPFLLFCLIWFAYLGI